MWYTRLSTSKEEESMKVITTNSFSETQQFGKDFAQQLTGGEVLALHGDLGSGKTTFVQGLAKGLGIERKIISPTFIIMRTYEAGEKAQGMGIRNLYHVDLYRIENEHDVEGLGLFELMNDPENIVVLEWPEKIINYLPEKKYDLNFTYIDELKRNIEIK